MLNLSFNFINSIKRSIFPFYKNKELKLIFKILQGDTPKETATARFVGGCVRKYLSGEEIDDIDIATTLTSDQVKNRFKDTNFKVIETGLKHGTLTLVSKSKKVEITTLRKDIRTDGRHALIEYTEDWKLDSERRDFTINAIYLDINGKIFDPQMGTVDLKNRNIKFIGDPQKRITEDYLRIIRFIRFKVMYDLETEQTTVDAIKQNLDGIKKISKERILSELLKILELKNFTKINENKSLSEIFCLIFPEFIYLDRLKRLHKIYDHSKLNIDILLAVLLIDEKDNHEYFSHKYNVSNKIKGNLQKFASHLKEMAKSKNFLEKNLLKNLYIHGKNHLVALNIINFTFKPKIQLAEFSTNLKSILKADVPKFHIDGDYLKKYGMQEGASLGKALKIVENEWIENNFAISQNRVKEIIDIYKI